MNVIKDLLDNPTFENKKLAEQLCLGIFRNSICELADDNFGSVQMNQMNDFMASFMLELSTVTIYNRRSTQYVASVRGKVLIMDPFEFIKKVDYDESKLKIYIEDFLMDPDNAVGVSRIFS